MLHFADHSWIDNFFYTCQYFHLSYWTKKMNYRLNIRLIANEKFHAIALGVAEALV